MHDIKVVITHEEAKALFYKHEDPIRIQHPWTGTDECGKPETEMEYIYDWMGCGRTSWGISWDDLDGILERPRKLLVKLFDQYKDNEYGPRGQLVFSCRKEVYPAVFYIILY